MMHIEKMVFVNVLKILKNPNGKRPWKKENKQQGL